MEGKYTLKRILKCEKRGTSSELAIAVLERPHAPHTACNLAGRIFPRGVLMAAVVDWAVLEV